METEGQVRFSENGKVFGTDDFRKCFPVENQYLRTYLRVVRYRSVVFPKAEHVAKFGIVPVFWYKSRKLRANSAAENTVFVTLEEEAKLYLVLLYYFMSIDDHLTYGRILSHLNRKVACLGLGTLREILSANGTLPERVLSEYVGYWSRHEDGVREKSATRHRTHRSVRSQEEKTRPKCAGS